ncbi:NAD(P)H-dependent oxidoreductase [Bacillus sp. FJAT-49736]|uniref:NADPH-dependent FMN reductase n=1 Tax=Bacillus sp. FJAT-49736 TaxID=2833582 RepID=UPI001BCA1822|nr:NAD(P)H-dependent oxidoreductase [Bacillus sp. FJAT-49736]MBS4174808.1 NAD(P)H-dependent oxidoreductase [Bacillus sp. FJAT-49736]MBS4175535.1 NAD(P)H-dependent oxidoreductase [Bacillus sp. FJAT-49736]
MKIVGISGALAGGKTLQTVHEVLAAAKNIHPAIESELIDLREYEIEFMRGTPLSYYNDDTQTVVNKMLQADLLVIGTPIYQASISGVLKNLFDLLPIRAFKSKVIGCITNGGSFKHFLVTQYQLKPILHYLEAIVVAKDVFVHNDWFDIETGEITEKDVLRRIHALAEDMIHLHMKKES